MQSGWQTVRVFISSTFRDMHAERDYLVKATFPRLRQWCEARRLHLVDIDLRWGVTKEEADNGRAIEICLQEIDGSRPFFVCILGNRYGWVPHDLPTEEHYLFRGLQQDTGLSITHLEIIHATQTPIPRRDGQHGEPCPHSSFYFRKPECIPQSENLAGLTDQQRQDFAEAFYELNPIRRGMLVELKQQIRDRYAGQGQVTDYTGVWEAEVDNPEDPALKGRLTGLEAFGNRVETDLQRAIAAQFADHIAALGKRDPLAEERSYHETFIENRTQVHVPRVDVETKLTEYADGTDERPLVLSGPPGSGKSAILSHWAKGRMKEEGGGKNDEFLIPRFIGASPGSTNLSRLLRNVCEELRQQFDLQQEVEEGIEVAPGQREDRKRVQPMEVPADPRKVLEKWTHFLEAASKVGTGSAPRPQRIVIVLDAINQLDCSADPSMTIWLPRKLPSGVRLILSVLDHGEASKPNTPSLHHSNTPTFQHPASPDWLRSLRRFGLSEVPVPELDDEARKQILRELPSVFCKTLEPRFVEQLLANPATRNPLFLIVALEELRVFGSFEQLPERIAQLPRLSVSPLPQAGEGQGEGPLCPTIDAALDAMFGQVLDRLERESQRRTPGLAATLFSYLASARDGLSHEELRALLARKLPALQAEQRNDTMEVILRQVRAYLMQKSSLLDFYHRSFWKAASARYLTETAARLMAHHELADYFTACARGTDPQKEWETNSVRGFAECVFHLVKAGQHDRAAILLSNFPFLLHKARVGLFEAVLEDYDLLRHEASAEHARTLETWSIFFREKAHIFRRGNDEWPAHKILLQLAVEHADDSPLTIGAEQWLTEGRCDWLWLRRVPRLPHTQKNPCLAVLEGHTDMVEGALALSDGRLLSWSDDNTLRLWDSQSGACRAVLEGHTDMVKGALALSDGRLLSWSLDKTLRLWDGQSGASLAVLEGHTSFVKGALALSDGRLLSWSGDQTLRLWDGQSGASLAVLEG
ncbi:MAG: DUF4062 domain-containing protein, partial [Verrucomicrobia bacterium]|nr:DUF4062 domain-containing protein [Verrucomicrobiota bacterium]